ncbi:hypothetical protein DUNSADRAFT_1930 [Dunaliella salina]|uniref:Uncharacterized protein n=1 Tax=Dunaliella salina TaxID=3046 RepID=A0ABQ7FWU2_DUNSA|nr:hypothetical protein DUNSADRAFT_1930 [Dunaliella salina]|eukprot:KAF5826830.1 hypothetical protein DUNSADRAFT_1930 [Dunaliella salina]
MVGAVTGITGHCPYGKRFADALQAQAFWARQVDARKVDREWSALLSVESRGCEGRVPRVEDPRQLMYSSVQPCRGLQRALWFTKRALVTPSAVPERAL